MEQANRVGVVWRTASRMPWSKYGASQPYMSTNLLVYIYYNFL